MLNHKVPTTQPPHTVAYVNGKEVLYCETHTYIQRHTYQEPLVKGMLLGGGSVLVAWLVD